MSTLWQDFAYGIRHITGNRWVTAIVAISLALGIGATTANFTMLDAILWKPLPVSEPNRLVKVLTVDAHSGRYHGVPPSLLRDLRERSEVFALAGVLGTVEDGISFRVSDRTERVIAGAVTASYFDVLGVALRRGE